MRRTVQRVFAAHLRPDAGPVFWPDLDLDLTGATLEFFDLKGVRVRHARFGGARFVGRAWFTGARFDGEAIFGGAGFEQDAAFAGARFGGYVRFRGAKFAGFADFADAVFAGEAVFGGTHHDGGTQVPDGAEFTEGATFVGARFARRPNFDHVAGSAVEGIGLLPGDR